MRRWSYTAEELAQAVASHESMAATLRALGLRPYGGNYATTWARIRSLGLDTSHWLGAGHLKGKSHNWSRARSLDDILVANSDYGSGRALKRRLLKAGLLEERCAIEGCQFHFGPLLHLGRPVTLHLDHINGNNRDHRLENLRFLCPLCHSQTDTYTGRNRGRYLRPTRPCVECGAPTPSTLRCAACRSRLGAAKCEDCGEAATRNRKRCRACAAAARKKQRTCPGCGCVIARRSKHCVPCAHRPFLKIDWPAPEELEARVRQSSFAAVARELGVSDNAVRKRLRAACRSSTGEDARMGAAGLEPAHPRRG